MDRAEWLAQRKTGLGASDAPAICGLSPWKTPLHIYMDKVGELDDADSEPKRWGRLLEDVVAEAYSEQTGREVLRPERMIERHRTIPWMLASLDRLAREPITGRRVLQCKTARAVSEDWGESGSDLVPGYYLLQCQQEMEVAGLGRCDLACLFGGQELRVYELERSQEILERMLPILEEFWRRVERRDPPPPTWQHPETPALVRALSKLAGVEPELTVALNYGAVPSVLRYQELKKQKKQLEKEEEEIYAWLLHAMGPAEMGTLPSGHQITRKSRHRKSYTVKESTYIELRIKEPR